MFCLFTFTIFSAFLFYKKKYHLCWQYFNYGQLKVLIIYIGRTETGNDVLIIANTAHAPVYLNRKEYVY